MVKLFLMKLKVENRALREQNKTLLRDKIREQNKSAGLKKEFDELFSCASDKRVPKEVINFLEKSFKISLFEEEKLNYDSQGPDQLKAHIRKAHAVIDFWKNMYVTLLKRKHINSVAEDNAVLTKSEEMQRKLEPNTEDSEDGIESDMNPQVSSPKFMPESDDTRPNSHDNSKDVTKRKRNSQILNESNPLPSSSLFETDDTKPNGDENSRDSFGAEHPTAVQPVGMWLPESKDFVEYGENCLEDVPSSKPSHIEFENSLKVEAHSELGEAFPDVCQKTHGYERNQGRSDSRAVILDSYEMV